MSTQFCHSRQGEVLCFLLNSFYFLKKKKRTFTTANFILKQAAIGVMEKTVLTNFKASFVTYL